MGKKTPYPENPKTFGQKIRKARMDKKMTIEGLADTVKVASGFISRVELGQDIPSPKTAKRIAEVLGKDTNDFIQQAIELTVNRHNKSTGYTFKVRIKQRP